MFNLLAMAPIEQGVFVFLLGLLIVFLGIGVIVVVVSVIGSIMKKLKNKPKAETPPPAALLTKDVKSDESEEIRAAIIAAVMACYAAEGNVCKFKIKKIKRI